MSHFASVRLMRHSENGVIARTYECVDGAARDSCRKSGVSVFESLDEYIDVYIQQYSGFADLGYDNFESIFLYYFLLCSLIFVAFSVHHLVKFARKNAILLRSLASDYWTQLTSGLRKLAVVLFSVLSSKWMKIKELVNEMHRT